jgi:NAD(P)-dependent dehydrogenase (short-subunit alcohol dehydrogenase family)
MRLEGKVAVVTGGANGIGRACCERFAEEGSDVVVADVQPADETVAAVKERGREALSVHVDASSEADNGSMIERALERFGRVDVLVTAAGVSHAAYVSGDRDNEIEWIGQMAARMGEPGAAILNLDVGEWQRVLDINLTGTMLAIRAAAKPMLEARAGSIVTIASVAAKRPEAGPSAYGVSKAGVWMLTKIAANQLAPFGIRVNSIGPGYIRTNMTSALSELPGVNDMLMQWTPMGRAGEPREVANVALFLASDEASYVTGELIHPDGGFYTD